VTEVTPGPGRARKITSGEDAVTETIVFVVAPDVPLRRLAARVLTKELGVHTISMRGGPPALAWAQAARPAAVVLRVQEPEELALARGLWAQPETRGAVLVVWHDCALSEDASGELASAALVDGQAPLCELVDAVRRGVVGRGLVPARP
jgi:hypothetical protein